MNQVNNQEERNDKLDDHALENNAEYQEIIDDGSNINQSNVAEELNKILPSSGFDFAFDKVDSN